MSIFDRLLVWEDGVAREGVSNMGVDEVLLSEVGRVPILRFYEWSRDEVSFGYFERFEEARETFEGEGLHFVRRWTGGGIVDHRVDLTYTLVVPRGHAVAGLRGAGSYGLIHEAVARALRMQAVGCVVIGKDAGGGESACFVNPVAFDVTDERGQKLAGAGQKRSRYGLLHQGSVQGVLDAVRFRKDFVGLLASVGEMWRPGEDLLERAVRLGEERYGSDAWLRKR